jgi:hypothetical protein
VLPRSESEAYDWAVAPLDQQALTTWIDAQLLDEKAAHDTMRKEKNSPHPHDPLAGGRRNVYGLVLKRMRLGDLPEIDDVERLMREFSELPAVRGGGSGFRQGQDEALDAVRAKAIQLMQRATTD